MSFLEEAVKIFKPSPRVRLEAETQRQSLSKLVEEVTIHLKGEEKKEDVAE